MKAIVFIFALIGAGWVLLTLTGGLFRVLGVA